MRTQAISNPRSSASNLEIYDRPTPTNMLYSRCLIPTTCIHPKRGIAVKINRICARLAGCFLALVLAACATSGNSAALAGISVAITGGYATDPRDGGRPVALVAGALGVPPDVFREAFSHVKPAPAGQEPDPAQVQLNKAALLQVLGPYGITNDRLDTVSDHYRFNGSAGETWPRTPATATALVTNGVVTGITITSAGSGYTSTPAVVISGSDATATATIAYGADFNTNGSLTAITLTKK